MIFTNSLQTSTVTAAASDPVTLAEAKLHQGIDHTDDDDLITALISAATEHVESVLTRSLVDRTLRVDLPHFGDQIVLHAPPIVSISQVQYYDADNALQTLATSAYTLDAPAAMMRRVYGQTYPTTYVRHDAVQITYVAGYGTSSSPAGSVPSAIKTAIKMLVSELYENRETSVTGLMYTKVPTVDMLLAPYRVYL